MKEGLCNTYGIAACFAAHVLLSFVQFSVSASYRLPMADPNWRKRLTPVLSDAVTLVSTLLDPNSTFLETLAQTQCLTEGQSDEIGRICSREGQTQAARHLFGILRRRPKPYFDIFCDVLGKVDQGEDLLRLLMPG